MCNISLLKEQALKALNEARTDVENKTTAALNAEYALGVFGGISKVIQNLDPEEYISLCSMTVDRRSELMRIIEPIYNKL
jgi:hypothetical protein